MRDAVVVVGANYGDEGKGLITDFEVRRIQAGIVTRFNGGAQAGHTVTTDSARHVFGHIGAGAFAGADTWLSSKFIVNPFVFEKELDAVRVIANKPPSVGIDGSARVSTLYDMALNSLAELQRGNDRHGSCGLGINETVTRHDLFPLTYGSLIEHSHNELIHQLRSIRDQWVPKRLQDLGITDIPEPYKTLLGTDDLMPMVAIMKRMLLNTRKRLTLGTPMVFEGAQGLALDEYLGTFPHVTRSMTGLPYAIVSAHELGVTELQPVYVTRAYFTRHGAGALANEEVAIGATVVDKTNVHNEWQGSIRYAPLDLYELGTRIANDQTRSIYIAQALGVNLFTPRIALTCMDQLAEKVPVVDLDKSIIEVRTENLPALIQLRLGFKISHISRGPKATDVEYFKQGI